MKSYAKATTGPVIDTQIKEFFKRWPRFYYFVFDYLGPVHFSGLGPKAFLKKYQTQKEGMILSLGSGARRVAADVVNVDIVPYPSVDIVADITKLPLEDESVTLIICDQVLEHVANPTAALDEVYRVLKPDGCVYLSTPYMYPFHASPCDYTRWTDNGMHQLTSRFSTVDSGVRAGPFSTLCVFSCYLLGSLLSFGNNRVYWIIVLSSSFLLFPIKLLDVVGNRLPFAQNMACVLYWVLKKKPTIG